MPFLYFYRKLSILFFTNKGILTKTSFEVVMDEISEFHIRLHCSLSFCNYPFHAGNISEALQNGDLENKGLEENMGSAFEVH